MQHLSATVAAAVVVVVVGVGVAIAMKTAAAAATEIDYSHSKASILPLIGVSSQRNIFGEFILFPDCCGCK